MEKKLFPVGRIRITLEKVKISQRYGLFFPGKIFLIRGVKVSCGKEKCFPVGKGNVCQWEKQSIPPPVENCVILTQNIAPVPCGLLCCLMSSFQPLEGRKEFPCEEKHWLGN